VNAQLCRPEIVQQLEVD